MGGTPLAVTQEDFLVIRRKLFEEMVNISLTDISIHSVLCVDEYNYFSQFVESPCSALLLSPCSALLLSRAYMTTRVQLSRFVSHEKPHPKGGPSTLKL